MSSQKALTQFKDRIGEATYRKLIERLQTVNSHVATYGIRWYCDRSLLLTGYSYGEFYDWDLYFENLYMSYYGISSFCRNNVESFLNEQLECGYVPRFLISRQKWTRKFHRQHFKPFLAQISLLGCRLTGQHTWLEGKYYDRLCKYLDYWFWYCDYDNNGLSIWDSADHSGMDNQFSRCGSHDSMFCEGADVNSYLVRELQAMAHLSRLLQQDQRAREFEIKAVELAERINAVLWDEQDGFYYDRNERTGDRIRVKSIAGFTPLWAGLAPTDRAERLIREHLLNPEEFWRPWPVATYARTEPDYSPQRQITECTFRGAAWVQMNYMIMHGLMRYGFSEEAEYLAYRTFEMVMNEENTREFYHSETGCGQGLNPFWGWSTLAYLMPLEYEMKYDASDLEVKTVQPVAAEVLGVKFPSYVGYKG